MVTSRDGNFVPPAASERVEAENPAIFSSRLYVGPPACSRSMRRSAANMASAPDSGSGFSGRGIVDDLSFEPAPCSGLIDPDRGWLRNNSGPARPVSPVQHGCSERSAYSIRSPPLLLAKGQ